MSLQCAEQGTDKIWRTANCNHACKVEVAISNRTGLPAILCFGCGHHQIGM